MSELGYIHSIETFGSVDGPGVRFVVFTQGCRFRCAFCHNPDTWQIMQKDNSSSHDTATGAQGSGNVDIHSPEEVLKKALRYKTYWGDEGGITVSGGEPLLQIDFLIEFFELCKKNNVNTCLDTAGGPYVTEPLIESCSDENQLKAYAANLGIFDSINNSKITGIAANLGIHDNTEIREKANAWHDKFLRLMKSTDIVLLDIKQINNEKHKALVGFSNENVLAMAKELEQLNVPVYIRHVLLPENSAKTNSDSTDDVADIDDGHSTNSMSADDILEEISDDEKDLYDLRAFIDTLSNVKKVEGLPYHTLGVYKYESLGIDYRLKDTDPPTDERIALAKQILCSK